MVSQGDVLQERYRVVTYGGLRASERGRRNALTGGRYA